MDASRARVVGACSSCRRSKVKCEHDGTAPCKRCKNGGYECAFKPREIGSAFLQDEWRVKTDETLTKLVTAINALVQQEDAGPPTRKRRTMDDAWGSEVTDRHTMTGTRGASSVSSVTATRVQAMAGPGSSYSLLAQRFSGNLAQSPSSNPYHYTATSFSNPEPYPGSTLRRSAPVPGMNLAINNASNGTIHAATSLNGASAMPQVSADGFSSTEANHAVRAGQRATGSLPLPSSPTKLNAFSGSPLPKPALLARSSRYRYPDPSLGSNDPRLDAIRLGLLSAHEARSLFSLYAKTVEPFGLGFPDFPASSDLTPVLLSAITCVAALHSPSTDLRVRHLRLRTDVLDRTISFAPLSAEDEFNPESGIGTEEVVGACVWSSYEGSDEGWKVARAARWWSEKYSYESGPHAGLTVGEMVAILPPVRHVNMQDRVRVWLTAFMTELHQCEIHDKEPIMELVDPTQYGQALGEGSNSRQMTKQDTGLVLFSRIAFLLTHARLYVRKPEELVKLTREVTASWCAARALLATERDQKDVYDHTIDLHHALAKASILIRACRTYEDYCAKAKAHDDVDSATGALVHCANICQSACMDSIRLLLTPRAGFMGNLAALPSIYHYWIDGCLVFLLRLCMPDNLHCQLGLLVEGQLDDILRTVGTFTQQYTAELSACSASIVVEEQQESEPRYETIKHPATDAALAIVDMLASVQATA